MTASPQDLLNTAWAACWVTSVGGSFDDDTEREDMAALALRMQHGLDHLDALDPEESETAVQALMAVFLELQDGTSSPEGQLAEALTPERVALAYTTLMARLEREADAHFSVLETLLASTCWELHELKQPLAQTDSNRQEYARLIALRDDLEAALLTGSRMQLSTAQTWLLGQRLREQAQMLAETPELLDTLIIMPDQKAALLPNRLQAAQVYLQAQPSSAVGIA
ncbi:hypothetical protein [Deinococcus ruber]|uniref:Uncharacterized protein n=1 Tax=Deinococcus ruber TaxID=1848197 RepID=A0A918F7J2_9DEIO|nr:hypothetical protein [Deinococcus ruber]GGR16512.1 hypothetical protein GCM10008957_31450 [Deinococcus ruber]